MVIIGFDVETIPIGGFEVIGDLPTQKEELTNLFTPKMTVCGFAVNYTEIYFDTVEMCQQFIFSSRDSHIFVAHNLQYDYTIIFDYVRYQIPKGWKCKVHAINGQFPRFSAFTRHIGYINKGGRGRGNKKRKTTRRVTIRFIDLMNFLKYSLSQLMQVYTPQYTKTSEFGIARNYADIHATREIYKEHFYELKNDHPLMSIASSAFHDLITTTGWKWEGVDKYGNNKRRSSKKWIIKAEQDSYKGGICWVNPKTRFQKHYAYYNDIVSMYPYIMKYCKVAIDFIDDYTHSFNTQMSKEYLKRAFEHDHEVSIFYVKCYTTEPILMIQNEEGRNELPVGYVEGWFVENELYYAVFANRTKITQFNILKEQCYKAKRGMFAPYVDKWYLLKQEIDIQRENLKNNGDQTHEHHREVERINAKLRLNSSYGRFGMRQRETIILDPQKEDDISYIERFKKHGQYSFHDTDNNTWYVRCENGVLFMETQLQDEAFSSCTINASIITAGARALLMSTFDDSVLYMDTDSQVRTTKLPESTNLGGWGVEKEGIFEIYDKKHYYLNGEIASLKGVPKKNLYGQKVELTHDFKFFFTRVVRPREALRQHIAPYSVKHMNKVMKVYKEKEEMEK